MSAKTRPHCGAKNKKRGPVLMVLLVIAAIAVIGWMGGEEETVLAGDNTPGQTRAWAAGETEPAVREEKNTFTVGETVERNEVTVSLIGVTESAGSMYNEPTDGNIFVLCEFEISNHSDEEVSISSIMSFEAYCDGHACAFSRRALMEKGNKKQLDRTVAPGKKWSGVIGYEVPVDWKRLEVYFTPDYRQEKDIVFIAENGA